MLRNTLLLCAAISSTAFVANVPIRGASKVVPLPKVGLPALRPQAPATSRAVVKMNDDEKLTAVPFEVRLPLGNVVVALGVVIIVYSFAAFFNNNGDPNTSLGFVYGFPVGLLGLSLKYAEVAPVPLEQSPAAERIAEAEMNPSMKQVISDVTRFRYADQHLEDVMNALKLRPSGEGPPELQKVVCNVNEDGRFFMELQFYSNKTPYTAWLEKAPRFGPFFGPNVRAEIRKLSAEDRLVGLRLVVTKEGDSPDPLEIQADGTVVNLTTKPITEGSLSK